MTTTRVLFGLLGLALMGQGVALVLDLASADLVAVAVWAALAVVVHDAVIAPLVLGLGRWSGGLGLTPPASTPARSRGSTARRATVAWFVIAGPLVVLAVPVLLGAGSRPDNPTLLDRAYVPGIVVAVMVAALAATLVTVGSVRHRGRGTAGEEG